jgi:hypothetical protein
MSGLVKIEPPFKVRNATWSDDCSQVLCHGLIAAHEVRNTLRDQSFNLVAASSLGSDLYRFNYVKWTDEGFTSVELLIWMKDGSKLRYRVMYQGDHGSWHVHAYSSDHTDRVRLWDECQEMHPKSKVEIWPLMTVVP